MSVLLWRLEEHIYNTQKIVFILSYRPLDSLVYATKKLETLTSEKYVEIGKCLVKNNADVYSSDHGGHTVIHKLMQTPNEVNNAKNFLLSFLSILPLSSPDITWYFLFFESEKCLWRFPRETLPFPIYKLWICKITQKDGFGNNICDWCIKTGENIYNYFYYRCSDLYLM